MRPLFVTVALTLLTVFDLVRAKEATHGQAEIEQVLDAQRAAWNRGDLQAFMQTYWRSPDLTFFSGDTVTQGWQSALDRYRSRYGTTTEKLGQLSFTDERIQMLGPDAALVTARWHLAMSNGRKLEGLTTVICRRMDQGWKIVHDHSS